MQLSIILLIAVSILTILSGISVLAGAKKGERKDAIIFFLATFFALFWAISIAITLALPESTSLETAKLAVFGIYLSAPLMCFFLMSYACLPYRLGRIFMGILAVACVVLMFFIIKDPNLLYESIELNAVSGNIVHLRSNWLNIYYGAYHFAAVFMYMIGLFYTILKTKSQTIKKANLMVLVGFTITGILALVFDFILPALGTYHLIWVGPLAMSLAWLFHYYAILKYRLLDLSGSSLRILSYIIIMCTAAFVYLTIFFIIFMALFKVSSPSSDVILLNILMVVVVILLLPAINEISSYIRSLTSVHDVDLVYVVKKLTQMSKDYPNYSELVGFLAEHLHFNYVGIIIDKKIHGTSPRQTKALQSNLDKIMKLKNTTKDIWLPLGDLAEPLRTHGIEAIAELKDSRGNVVGLIALGRPLGAITFQNRDLSKVETALTLTATMLSKAS
ncbi:hypothetical protein IKG20_02935 [Candidatus Saccharibacteria bacterium]|nr:hypothetical protein [Candidatus Saccharibacteria bacterium]